MSVRWREAALSAGMYARCMSRDGRPMERAKSGRSIVENELFRPLSEPKCPVLVASKHQGGNNIKRVGKTDQQSYQAALRDAVPPYWDTTVVLPSSNSPWGPLHSSMSGDEILIDGMPSGNMFGFVWNCTSTF